MSSKESKEPSREQLEARRRSLFPLKGLSDGSPGQ